MFDARVKAVLGPTNTGKTHLAIERMLAHSSGIIGFPLRLLARENYDRMVAAKGAQHVALITGEEKIVPPEAQLVRLHGGGHAARPPRSNSSRWTRSSSAPTPIAAMSSPTACCTRAAWSRPCSWAPRRSARCCSAWCRRPRSRPGRALSQLDLCRPRQADPPAAAHRRRRLQRRRGLCHRRADPPPARRLRRGDGPALARAPATPRWRSTRTARSISWWPPTPSAWA